MALPASGYGLSSTLRHEFGIGIFQPLLLIDRDKPGSLPHHKTLAHDYALFKRYGQENTIRNNKDRHSKKN
jgi:hypothetical protein